MMNTQYKFLVFAYVSILLHVAGCAATREPRLSEFQVIAIANRVAETHAQDLSKYEPPDARYEYAQHDQSWWVFYRLKPHDPMHHFSVFVQDKTKKAKYYPPQ